ncbi:MAG: hypothetical protein AAFR71_09890 [Pseudomonadota bacterium]
METPDIPEIGHPDFDAALSALVRSASVVRELLLMSITSDVDIKRLMARHSDLVMNADAVIDAWRDHLGITDRL